MMELISEENWTAFSGYSDFSLHREKEFFIIFNDFLRFQVCKFRSLTTKIIFSSTGLFSDKLTLCSCKISADEERCFENKFNEKN